MNDESSDPRGDLDLDNELRSGPSVDLQLVASEKPAATPPPAPVPVPLRNYVLLESEKDRRTASGLHIPDDAGPPCAIVICFGPETKGLSEGDRVLLDAPPGTVGKFRWGGKTYRLCQDNVICAVLPGDLSFAEASPEILAPAPKVILAS